MTTFADDTAPRNVLVVAYYFPPMGLSGVQRTLKFVKYLPKYGWYPTVLTVDPRGYLARDESLLQELDGRPIKIVRTAPAGPSRALKNRDVVPLPPERKRKMLSRLSDTLFIPDNKIGWRRRAVSKGLALHAETPFRLIFSTAPPFTDFLVGMDLKARMNIPLVFDYRDPWADYPFKFYPTPFHRWRNTAMERDALRASSHVVTTNRRVKELLIERYGFLGYHDVDIIPQGYDPDDFEAAAKAPPAGSELETYLKQKGEKMWITYAGVFWEDRVPDHFLRALHELFEENPRLRGRVEAVFAGNFREENLKLVNDLGLQQSVHVLGYLPHAECLRAVVASDVVWVTVGDNFGSPGKTYEYIGARKPILGLVPEGFLKSTITEAGGVTVPPADVSAIKQAIKDLYDKFEHRALPGPSPEVVEKYNRVHLTGALVRIFESLLAP